MAVTFTAKGRGRDARASARSRRRGVSARTFHAAALAQVNFFWPTLAGDQAPSIIDNKVRMLAHAADGVGLAPDTATLRDVASAIEWRKVTLRSIEQYAADRPDGVGRLGVDQVVALQRAYEKLKDERRQMDFEDVLLTCAGMIEAEPRVAAAVREQYRHFTVDEYQDVSPLQNRLLELWLGDRRDLCVVGDASQTVYSFTAPMRGTCSISSAPTTTRARRASRAQLPLHRSRARRRERPHAGPGRRPRAEGRERRRDAYPDGPRLRRRRRRGRRRGRSIRDSLSRGVDPHDIAVLYRSHAQSAALLSALAKVGVAASVLGGRKFFDLPEVRQALMALRGGVRGAARDGLPSDGARCAAQRRAHRRRPRRAVPCARRGRRGRLCCGWPRRPRGYGSARFHRRPAGARPRSARADHPHGDAGDAARGEGSGVGSRVPRGSQRRAPADLVREDVRGGRRGATPRVRGRHAGRANVVGELGAGPRSG